MRCAIKYCIFTLILLVVILPTLLTIANSGFIPVGDDEGRYLSYAYYLSKEGQWSPYVVKSLIGYDPSFYQIFHFIPFLTYTVSNITGLEIVHSQLLLVFISSFLIGIAITALFSFKNVCLRFFIATLLIATPPISGFLNVFTPQKLCYLFIMFSFLYTYKTFKGDFNWKTLALLFGGIATIIHGVSLLILLPVTAIFALFSKRAMRYILTAQLMVFFIIFVSWYTIYTNSFQGDAPILKNGLGKIIEFLLAKEPLETSKIIKGSSYETLPYYLCLSWLLLPIIGIILLFKNVKVKKWFCVLLISVALVEILYIFIDRLFINAYSRYFYAGYFLLLLCILTDDYVKNFDLKQLKHTKQIFFIILFLFFLFMGLQAPELSPYIYKSRPIPDVRDSYPAKFFMDHMPSNHEVSCYADIRIFWFMQVFNANKNLTVNSYAETSYYLIARDDQRHVYVNFTVSNSWKRPFTSVFIYNDGRCSIFVKMA